MASSVITAVVRYKYSIPSELYNITVTCTIHPDSTADQCVVMAMDDNGRVNRTGNLFKDYTYVTMIHMFVKS